jgi:hypothetical protein
VSLLRRQVADLREALKRAVGRRVAEKKMETKVRDGAAK